jgi:DNA-binding NarL/FixJ family response regulator
MTRPPSLDQAAASAVLIVKPDRLYAEALRELTLRAFPAADVRLASTLEHARAALRTAAVDVLVTGVGASLGGDVIDFLARCAGQSDWARRVLVVTTHQELRILVALRTLPIQGVFDSTAEPPEEFLGAIRTVARGGHYWSHSLLERLRRLSSRGDALPRLLTTSEQLVLSVIGGGSDNASAARELGLSPATISSVRRELHRKLGVQHRGDLIRIAAQSGFVQFAPSGVIRPGFGMLTAAYEA